MPRAIDFAGAPGHGAPKEPRRSARPSRQLEAHAVCRRERPVVVLGGRGAVARRRPRIAGALRRRGHRSRPRTRAREGVAREQRLPAGPQDQPGARVRAALRAGDPSAVHAGPGSGDDASRGAPAQVDAPPRRPKRARGSRSASRRRPLDSAWPIGGRSQGEDYGCQSSRRGTRAPIIPVRPRRHAYPDQFARVEGQTCRRVPRRRARRRCRLCPACLPSF